MPHIISTAKARRIASEWHGGQASALYAFASTGTVIAGFLGECRQAEKDAIKSKQSNAIESIGYWEAIALAAFAEYHFDGAWADLRGAVSG